MRKFLEETNREPYVPRGGVAMVHFGLGEKERGFQWLEKAIDERDGMIFHLDVDPLSDLLRPDPRYHALLPKMRLEN